MQKVTEKLVGWVLIHPLSQYWGIPTYLGATVNFNNFSRINAALTHGLKVNFL